VKIKLQISGILNIDRMPYFLLVENVSDIKMDTILDEDLAKAAFLPRKRKLDSNIEIVKYFIIEDKINKLHIIAYTYFTIN